MLVARVIAVTLVALAFAGCSGSDTGSPTGHAAGDVVELTSLATLKEAFSEGEGKPRLLLLLSPT